MGQQLGVHYLTPVAGGTAFQILVTLDIALNGGLPKLDGGGQALVLVQLQSTVPPLTTTWWMETIPTTT